ncbi:response regulator [Vibrio cholerae]|nr:response regulator [Vibrio cholerae]
MNKFLILCVDDEREVLDSVVQDLDCFEEHFIIEAAESVAEAKSVIEYYRQEAIPLALILCDHIMPEQTGIQFLIELNQEADTTRTRKMLLTGQAGLWKIPFKPLTMPVYTFTSLSLGMENNCAKP